jgi:hypothetical protein
VDRDDVRVREAGRGPGLVLEPLDELGVGRERRLEDLHCDGAVQEDVVPPVDLAHPAPGDARDEPVTVRQCLADQVPHQTHLSASVVSA